MTLEPFVSANVVFIDLQTNIILQRLIKCSLSISREQRSLSEFARQNKIQRHSTFEGNNRELLKWVSKRVFGVENVGGSRTGCWKNYN